jgi:inosine-uridine nucleoside N-ribohydrolase
MGAEYGRANHMGRKPVLLDTDLSPDSWVAVLFLCQRGDLDVRSITVAGTGESHSRPGVSNARRLAALAGRPQLPIAGGRSTPLAGSHRFPLIMRWLMDRMLFVSVQKNPHPPLQSSAVELITSVIQNSPQKATLVSVGGLTNVAEAIYAMPHLVDKVEMLYIMGGAVDVPGNIREIVPSSPNEFAEWNIYVDPLAASVVFRSGLPITLVPLDATNQNPVSQSFLDRLTAERTTPAADTAYRVINRITSLAPKRLFYLWDPMTVAVALEPSLGTFEQRTLKVIEEEGPQSGRTIDSPDGSPIRVCKAIDLERFEQLLIDTLNGRLK